MGKGSLAYQRPDTRGDAGLRGEQRRDSRACLAELDSSGLSARGRRDDSTEAPVPVFLVT